MKLSNLFLFYAVIAATTCLLAALDPQFWVIFLGTTADAKSAEPVRMIGAVFGGLAVTSWMGRNSGSSPARDAMVWGLGVSSALQAAVILWGVQSGVYYHRAGWASFIVAALFAVAFIAAAVRTSSSAAQPVSA